MRFSTVLPTLTPRDTIIPKLLICNAFFTLYCILKINVLGLFKSSTVVWAALMILCPLFLYSLPLPHGLKSHGNFTITYSLRKSCHLLNSVFP